MSATMKAMTRRIATMLVAAAGVLGVAQHEAAAQEIQVTGPLAGAPAVRKLRQHRKGRVEIAPAISFSLLDEYQRTIFFGAKLNYNITDWLAIGLWGAFGGVHTTTSLSDNIQTTYNGRFNTPTPGYQPGVHDKGTGLHLSPQQQLMATNVGADFKKQLGTMNWVIAPQLTAVPFRGKLSIFEKIFVDTDAYLFAGPAFVGITERKDCGAGTGIDCGNFTFKGNGDPTVLTKPTASRVAIAPTFGIGFNFYTGRWGALGLEWRGLPFSWNTGGFDTKGAGTDKKFPDNKITSDDHEFKFNQVMTVSYSIFLPLEPKVSE